jgi:hypothetical protein
LDRNIEIGVLIRDRAFALTVDGYFRSLIDRATVSTSKTSSALWSMAAL